MWYYFLDSWKQIVEFSVKTQDFPPKNLLTHLQHTLSEAPAVPWNLYVAVVARIAI
jgi:hypothetical protein